MQSRQDPNPSRYVDAEVLPPQGQGNAGMKPKNKQGKAIGHLLFKPIVWLSNSAKWLTNPTAQGGAKYVMWTMAVGCLALSIENSYCLFAGSDKKFLPKPGINDGAELSRILPLGDAGNAIVGTMADGANLMGARIQKPVPFRRADLLVWADPRFYGGLILCLMVNGIQAMALRRVSLQMRTRQLAKSQQTDSQINSAVKSFEERAAERRSLETNVRVNQVKHYGNGNVLSMGAIVAASYIYEFSTFFANSAPGVPFLGTLLLGMASVFGAEVLWATGEHMDKRQEAE